MPPETQMEEIEELKKTIQEHEDRISKLEKQLSSKSTTSKKTQTTRSDYKGTSGGVQFLIDNGFFNNPKSSQIVHEEMKREGYHKPIKNIDATLRLVFVKKKILERIKEGKIWNYVIRK